MLALLLAVSPTVFYYIRAANVTFSDTNGHWAEAYIGKWAAAGVIFGYGDGTFRPENHVTKAEFSSVLNQLFEFTETAPNVFVDVENTDWFAPIISKLVAANIVTPDSNNMINPNRALTRGELIVMMAKAYNIPPLPGETSFLDDATIEASQKPYVKALQDADLIVGYGVPNGYEIRTDRLLTRAEMLTVLDRAEEGQRQDFLPTLTPTLSTTLTPTPSSAPVAASPGRGSSWRGWGDGSPSGDEDQRQNLQPTLPPIPSAPLTPTPPDTPVVTPPGGGGSWGGGGNGSPGGNDSGPTIIVHTAFPSSTITDNIVDITYTATPGAGAFITEVSYLINGHAEEFLYLADFDGITPRGTLGEGRVLLVPGENSIVFTAMDSDGNTANYIIQHRPYYDFGTMPELDMAFVEPLPSDPTLSFVNNRVTAVANSGVTVEEVNSASESIGGRIVGQVNLLRWHIIEVDSQTEEGLRNICDELMNTGLFSNVHLNILDDSGIDTFPTNDPWWNDGTQWGLDAISAPQAWENYDHIMREITLGVIDNGVRYGHEDLMIPRDNVINANIPGRNISMRYRVADHGTHVMGTIGAIHDNGLGLSGVINTRRTRLFAYDSFRSVEFDGDGYEVRRSTDAYRQAGLAWLVANGAKVVNVSIGGFMGNQTEVERNASRIRYEETLTTLLGHGYDFIVVQSAGNGREVNGVRGVPFDASQNSAFTRVTRPNLVNQIIVVGATDSNGRLTSSSNYGYRVDVVAPGHRIFSARAGTFNAYESINGTSMAAPHVTGLAGMVWSANPGLTGYRVREIIIDSADPIQDNRSNLPEGVPETYPFINALAAMEMARNPIAIQPYRIVGQVVNATDGSYIEGASVAVIERITNSEVHQWSTVLTDHEGRYNTALASTGNLLGRFALRIDAPGFIPEVISPLTLERGVNVMPTIRVVPSNVVAGEEVFGNIVNDITGEIITDPVTLEFRNSFQADGEIVYSRVFDNGRYSVELPAGNYNVTAVSDEYITTRGQVISLFGVSIYDQNIYLIPINPTPTLPMLSDLSILGARERFTADGVVVDISLMWTQFPAVEEYHIYYRLRGTNPFQVGEFRYAGSTQNTLFTFTVNRWAGAEIRIEATTATSRIVFGNNLFVPFRD